MEIDVDMNDPAVAKIIKNLMKCGVVEIVDDIDDIDGHCIYILAVGNRSPVKCGITSNLKRRCRALSSSSGRNLRVVFAYPLSDNSEARKMESAAHAALSNFRTRGEWFKVTPKRAKEIVLPVLFDDV